MKKTDEKIEHSHRQEEGVISILPEEAFTISPELRTEMETIDLWLKQSEITLANKIVGKDPIRKEGLRTSPQKCI